VQSSWEWSDGESIGATGGLTGSVGGNARRTVSLPVLIPLTTVTVMAHKQKKIDPLPCSQPLKNTAKNRLSAFLSIFEKEDTVLVIINADPDALASALAVKRLLRYKVKNVTIAHPNEIRRLNNLAMVDRLKIPLLRLKDVKLENYSKRVMVDSQPDHLPCFEKIKLHAIIDHHPVGYISNVEFVDIRPEYGATSSMVVEYLRAAGLKPSVALATALFYGIKVDTQDFEQKSVLADGISFRYLFNIANRDLVRKFELTDLRRSELRYFATALADLKYSKGRYYVHLGRVRSPDVLVGEKLVVIFRCDGYRKSAGKLAERIFGSLGSAGGHKGAARAEIPLKNLQLGEKEFTSESLKRLVVHHF